MAGTAKQNSDVYNLAKQARIKDMANLTPQDVDTRLTVTRKELMEEDIRLWNGLEDEKVSRIAGDDANKAFTQLVQGENQGTESRLSTEVIHRSEGDLNNLGTINALSKALNEYRIKTDLEIANEAIARKALGVELNTRIDKAVALFDSKELKLYQAINAVQSDVDYKYGSMDTRIKKYENMLQDITTDSIQITMDNGEINMGAWTILSQAREWDLEILSKVKGYQQQTTEDLNQALEDLQNKLPVEQDIIDKAIQALSEAPIIKELDAKLETNIESIKRIDLAIFQEAIDRQNALIEMANENAIQIKSFSDELSTKITEEATSRIQDISKETAVRMEQVALLEDGLTTEIQDRIDGDNHSIELIHNLKVSNEEGLANIRQELKVTTDKTNANATELKALDARVVIAEGNASKALVNSASAVTKAEAAVTATTALASRVTSVEASLEGKASTAALNELKTSVTALDGKVTTVTQSMTALESKVNSIDGTVKGHTTAINSLTATQTQQGKDITSISNAQTVLSNKVTSIEGTVATKADSSVVAQLDNRVTLTEGKLTAQGQSITNINSRIDNISIGARNYLLNSRKGGSNKTLVADINKYLFPKTIISMAFDIDITAVVSAGVSNRIGYEFGFRTAAEPSRVYYASVWLNNASTKPIGKYRVQSLFAIPDSWVNGKDELPAVFPYYSQVSGGAFTTSNVQMEIASIPSDWSPAPEDQEVANQGFASSSALNSLSTRVTNAENTITSQGLSITKVEATATKLDGKVGLSKNYKLVTHRDGGPSAVPRGIYDANGKMIKFFNRGLSMCTWDENSEIDYFKVFDVYVNTPVWAAALDAAIKALPVTKYFMISGCDNISDFGSNTDPAVVACRNTLISCGLPETDLYSWRFNTLPIFFSRRNASVLSSKSIVFFSPYNNGYIEHPFTIINGVPQGLGDGSGTLNTLSATATAISQLEGRVDVTEAGIKANSQSITALTATVAGKADSKAVTDLTTTVTQQGKDITSQANRTTTLISSLADSNGNLIRNGNGEYGTALWNKNSPATATLNVWYDHLNRKYLRYESADTTTPYKGINQAVTLAQGLERGTYTLSFKCRSLATSMKTLTMLIHRRDSSGNDNQLTASWDINTSTDTAISYTFSTDIANLQYIDIILTAPTGVQAVFGVREVMVQRGTLATGYIENIDNMRDNVGASTTAISKLTTDVSNLDGKVTSQGTQITGLQTQIADKADAAALNSLKTTVEQQDNVITSQGAAITQVESKISNLKAGARNYLLGSATYGSKSIHTDINKVLYAGSTISMSFDIEITTKVSAGLRNRIGYECAFNIGSRLHYVAVWLDKADEKPVGKYRITNQYVIPNGWLNGDSAMPALFNYYNQTSSGAFTVSNVQMEVGNILTDWNPAPEDLATTVAMSSLDAKVTSIDGRVTATSSSLTQLETKVGNNTAAIAVQGQSINGIKAEYTIKLDVGGLVSGIGLINDGKSSAIGINADFFYVGKPTNGKKPFMVLTSAQTIGGVTYPAGTWIDVALIANATIGTAKIADASITNAKIANLAVNDAKIANLNATKITAGTIAAARIGAGTITADKIQVNNLSAISANLGTFTTIGSDNSKRVITGGSDQMFYPSGRLAIYIGL